MKKLTIILLALIVVLFVSACVLKKEKESVNNGTAEQTTAQVAEKPQSQPAEGGTTAPDQNAPAQTPAEETTTVYTEDFTFVVPEGSSVTVNGEKLENPFSGELPEVIRYSSEFVYDIPEYVSYTKAFAPEGISVQGTDADGNQLVFDVAGNVYTGASAASSEFIDEVSGLVEDGLYCWGLYFINKSELKKYVYYDSELWGMIFGSSDYDWINNTFYNYEYITDYNYTELQADNYRTYGDECFTVDVRYQLDVSFEDPGRTDPNQNLDATMVWLVEGDSWSIADIFYHERIDEYPVKDGIEVISLNEKTFTGKLIVVQDPSRVFAGVIDDLGSYTGLKIPAVLEEYKAAGYQIVGGVNGGDFIDTGTYVYTGTPLGLVISEGDVAYQDEGYDATYRIAGFTDDNKLIFGYYSANEALEMGIRDAIHCETDSGPFLVENGQLYEDIPDPSEYGSGKNARTAIGQREDGAVLLMCVDGRQANSLGATFYDLAEEMIKYGAVTAVAMDGGSSTQMGYELSPGQFGYINHPFTPAYGPRACPTFWLIK